MLGAPLYGASPPTGYPDTAAEWTSANAILARMEVGGRLAGLVFGGRSVSGQQGRGGRGRGGRGRERGPQGTVEERTDALIAQILPGGMSPDTRDTIQAWGAAQDSTPGNAEIATLILGSPEFQRR